MVEIAFDKDVAERFESLGDNCEFGFVNRKLKIEHGSLFRWASMKPTCLLALLLNDFRGIYEYSNLSPLRLVMVQEKIYSIGWHTSMKSEHAGSRLQFAHSDDERRLIYKYDLKKMNYLIEKFRARLKSGGVIYFLKSNSGISQNVVDAIFWQLTQLAEGAPFWLVHVRSADEGGAVGTVKMVGERRLNAFVESFAAYNTADEFDLDVWKEILNQVVALAPYEGWKASTLQAKRRLEEKFKTLPFASKQNLGATDIFEEKFGSSKSTILNVHHWTRVIESDTLRVHAPDDVSRPTAVIWSGLQFDDAVNVSIDMKSAVPDSIPVNVKINVIDNNKRCLVENSVSIKTEAPQTIDLKIPSVDGGLDLVLSFSACQNLKDGERAVVDISTPSVSPSE